MVLRLLESEDAPAVFAYASDPEVAKNTAWFPHESLDDTESYVGTVVGSQSTAPGQVRLVWAIRIEDSTEAVGTIDLVQDSADLAHIDFALARTHWNQGFMTEACLAVVSFAFSRIPSLTELRSGGLSRNVGTMRVLERVGFRERARTRVPRPPKFPDEELEATHFSLKREWLADVTTRGGAS